MVTYRAVGSDSAQLARLVKGELKGQLQEGGYRPSSSQTFVETNDDGSHALVWFGYTRSVESSPVPSTVITAAVGIHDPTIHSVYCNLTDQDYRPFLEPTFSRLIGLVANVPEMNSVSVVPGSVKPSVKSIVECFYNAVPWAESLKDRRKLAAVIGKYGQIYDRAYKLPITLLFLGRHVEAAETLEYFLRTDPWLPGYSAFVQALQKLEIDPT